MTLPRFRRPNNGKRKSNLPKDEHGKIKPSPGRPPGVPNKITHEAKQIFALAFQGAGGLPRMIEWINRSDHNRGIFYSLYAKLIPLQLVAQLDATVKHNGDEDYQKLVTHFHNLIDARKIEEREREERTGLVVIDGKNYRRSPNGTLTPTDEVMPRTPKYTVDGVGYDDNGVIGAEEHREPAQQEVLPPDPAPPKRKLLLVFGKEDHR